MPLYKRNQLEEALSAYFNESTSMPSTELRTRVKRLLDSDRALGRNKRSPDPEISNYAFYSEAPPGKGAEIGFSDYEAFAVLVGLQLMRHGWPQGFPVKLLRGLRADLEGEHARILKQDPAELFDQVKLRQNARPGILVFDNTDPVFLAIVTPHPSLKRGYEPLAHGVFRGTELLGRFLREKRAEAYTFQEIATAAHILREHLSRTTPRKRGRS